MEYNPNKNGHKPWRMQWSFRATAGECAEIDNRAKELGMNRSEYIRYLTRKDIYEATKKGNIRK